MSSGLEVVDVSGGYTTAPVLRDVTIEVRPNEIVGLLGANGAGKSTLLRALSGSLPRVRGDILLDGTPLHHLTAWQRVAHGLAHVPEGRHVFGAMTVKENLDVGALAGKGRVNRDELLDLFPRLREREAQTAGSLSGGEQQMLAIARALMTAPRVLAVDEMSAGLAPVLVEQLVAGLVQLRVKHTGVLLVEQSPNLIANAVDRVYLLEQGRIVGQGTLAELGGAERLAALYLGV